MPAKKRLVPAKRLTLLTNIREVSIADLRLDCHAVLIEDGVDGFFGNPPYTRIRGFGTDGAWQVFQAYLPAGATWKVGQKADSRDTALFIGHDGEVSPLFSGYMLDLSDGRSFFIHTEDAKRPLDVVDAETDICTVWDILTRKTAHYWHAPNMPVLRWCSADDVRGILGE